jgi:hypothetical protein
MNTTQRTIGTGIAAIIAGIVTVGAGLDADAANRPSPEIHKRPAPAAVTVDGHRPSPDLNKRPKPAVVTMPCPAADDIPECDLSASASTTTEGGCLTARRTATAVVGGVAVVNVGRITPSAR